jgi:hypothetical protein
MMLLHTFRAYTVTETGFRMHADIGFNLMLLAGVISDLFIK